jgi:hypothetical protein
MPIEDDEVPLYYMAVLEHDAAPATYAFALKQSQAG